MVNELIESLNWMFMLMINFNQLISSLESFSIITAAIVAVYGINAWRRDIKWKRRSDLAEEVRSLFYEVQDALDVIRSPFGHTNEGRTRKRREEETSEESGILDNAYVTIERYNEVKEPFIKLKAKKYRFMAVFGRNAGKPFEDILILVNRILGAANRLGLYWKDLRSRNITRKQMEELLKRKEKDESMIWSDYSEVDEVRKEMEKIIDRVEVILRRNNV